MFCLIVLLLMLNCKLFLVRGLVGPRPVNPDQCTPKYIRGDPAHRLQEMV